MVLMGSCFVVPTLFSHANLAPPNVTGAIQSRTQTLRSAGVSPVVLQRVGSEKHRRDAGATTHVMRISPSSKRKDACAVHETYQCFSIAARLVRAADTMIP